MIAGIRDEWQKRLGGVARAQFEQFVGQQYIHIERFNHHKVSRNMDSLPDSHKKITLNGSQLSRIVLEADKPSHDVYRWQHEATNVWNIINYGTEEIKVERGTDFANVLGFNSGWVQLVKAHFAPQSLN